MKNINLTDMENIKCIEKLIQHEYFIPSYQRGYRWTKKQVEDLLNDVSEFGEIAKEGEWYCLQPIVVKKVKDEDKDKYEVLDGQQRITTIFLVLKALGFDTGCFEITYKTREESQRFLKEISSKTEPESRENIDFHHMYEAYKTINDWFTEEKKEKFKKIFIKSTKVIWHEIDENSQESIDVFIRVNQGKIPLKSAELVKALFLKSAKCEDNGKESYNRQVEIASEWDRIEYTLQNDDFWYFISNDAPSSPRIEYILGLFGEDPFTYFDEKLKKRETLETCWQEIKKRFLTIEEWFMDRELYHKIAYLVTIQNKDFIKNKLMKECKSTKTDFKEYLNREIKSSLPEIIKEVEELEYGNPKVKQVLLLHNIETMLSNPDSSSRFPFDSYKKQKWHIEHIHALAQKMPEKEDRETWIKDSLDGVEYEKRKEDLEKLQGEEKLQDEEFKKVFEEIKNDTVNDISNLALLDASTNTSMKNAMFRDKRKDIIDNDKKGTFIPICTRNVFLKYYSTKREQMVYWSDQNRGDYWEDIKSKIKKYLNDI